MKNILHDLYFGRIDPMEHHTPYTDEYKELDCKSESDERYFKNKMSGDDYQRFEYYKELLWRKHSNEEVDMFSHGFKLGALFMIEIFSNENGLSNNGN